MITSLFLCVVRTYTDVFINSEDKCLWWPLKLMLIHTISLILPKLARNIRIDYGKF